MNYNKLRGRIRECYGRQGDFAAAMDMSEATLSKKLCGGTEWTRPEMELACQLLGVPIVELPVYFFTI